MRKISQKGLDLIARFEGLRLEAYLDTLASNHIWTIGYGHTKTAKKGMVITNKEALALLKSDCEWVEEVLNREIKVPVTQAMFDALASLTFNIGERAFMTSTLLERLNHSDYAGAQAQFHVWRKAGGKVVQGLVNRRAEEAKHFALEGLYARESWWVRFIKWLKGLAGATA